MATKDINLVSLCGPEHSGTPEKYAVHEFQTLNGSNGYSDTLKTSTSLYCAKIYVGELIGGKEDCWDSNNHCENVLVEVGTICPTGKYIWTNKGGCKNMALKCHNVQTHGGETDVDLGNNSNQGYGQTGTKIDLKMADGSPVKVRVLRGDKPEFVAGSGPYQYVFPHPDAWYHGICVKILDVLFKIGLI